MFHFDWLQDWSSQSYDYGGHDWAGGYQQGYTSGADGWYGSAGWDDGYKHWQDDAWQDEHAYKNEEVTQASDDDQLQEKQVHPVETYGNKDDKTTNEQVDGSAADDDHATWQWEGWNYGNWEESTGEKTDVLSGGFVEQLNSAGHSDAGHLKSQKTDGDEDYESTFSEKFAREPEFYAPEAADRDAINLTEAVKIQDHWYEDGMWAMENPDWNGEDIPEEDGEDDEPLPDPKIEIDGFTNVKFKTGWLNYGVLVLALIRTRRYNMLAKVIHKLRQLPAAHMRLLLLESHIQKFGDSGPRKMGYRLV